MHVLGMVLLVYMTLNLDELRNALAPNMTKDTQVFSQNFILKEEMQPESFDYMNGDMPILLQQTNVNITMWITNFVINNPSSNGLPTRNQLNMAMIFCSINAVAAILAICGVAKVRRISIITTSRSLGTYK